MPDSRSTVDFDRTFSLEEIRRETVSCRLCPRLVAWREAVGKVPPKRHTGETYWAAPVPSLGEHNARLILVGLAPAAHGSNRTGRMFTGDRSGEWLFRAMWKAGFANQPNATHRGDGFELRGAYIAATCHCAPPQNKPLPSEIANCRPFLLRELEILERQVRLKPIVFLGLGKIGFDACFEAARDAGLTTVSRPKFGHGAEAQLNENLWLLGTYHPSQQNTFTGKLTETMLDAVFTRVHEILG